MKRALTIIAAFTLGTLQSAVSAEPGAASTKNVIDFKKPAKAEQLVGPAGHVMIAENPKVKNQWTFADGILTASSQWDSLITPETYHDFRLHVEFNVNERPGVHPEKNGNSGVYIQQRYEIQILNSHSTPKEAYKASYAGSLYKQKMPDKLVSKPAGEWQTYDIAFRAARFVNGEKTEGARITVYHNQELIHDDYELKRQTGAGKKEGPQPGPIKLQGHQNQVRFRNVWIQRLKLGALTPAPKKEPVSEGKKKKKGYTYIIPFENIPAAPALKPAKALETFRIHEEFAMELAVADPHVQTPLAMKFDADGRMWVVEQRAYMLDADGTDEDKPIGRISVHEDTNGDGTFDKSWAFLDKLNQPRSIAFYKGGVLYGGHEKLYFVENNDGKAGEMTVIDENYTQKGNVEHRTNGLFRALDNWIYNVKSDARYREINGKWVKQKTAFRGQWGMSQDNYGRLHYNENWYGMRVDQLYPNLLMRNKNFLKNNRDTTALSFRDKLYPARVTPGVNRGGEGAIDENGILTAATAACGPVRYRGDQFSAEFANTAFFCEPAANLVRMINVSTANGLYKGEHRLGEREFLASTDERFRPVDMQNGPDGTVYIVDMYHGILQHKGYLTRYLREHVVYRNLDTFPDLGRIYRIRHKASPLKKAPKMSGKSAMELAPLLAHGNGWVRDTAQQLIVDSGDKSVVPVLNELAAHPANPLARIHALWCLEGLGAVNATAVDAALHANDPYAIEAAIRVAELLPAADAETVFPMIEKAAKTSSPIIQRQLAASLGRIQSAKALPLLKQVLLANLETPYVRELAINGLEGREREFQTALGDDLKDSKFKDYLTHALELKTTAGAFKLPRDKNHLASFKRGEKAFIATCMACHGADGNGMEMLGPPLVGSEWVTGSDKRLAAILLQGLHGPIKVNGKTYTPAAPMPGLKDAPGITDEKLADIATFVRHAWNNRKGAVKPQTIAEVRKKLGDRATMFTPEELQKTFR